MFGKIVKTLGVLTFVGGAGLIGYLLVAPPDLLKVGTNYSAKIVCSNVFIAGRDPDEVLAVDVQAPGHPLLKQVSIDVDQEAQSVQARLFRFFAPATSQFREGLGCTNVHDAALSDQSLVPPNRPAQGLWPAGDEVALSQDPQIQSIMSDEALLGEGYRAVVVVRNGRIVTEAYADGFDAQTPLLGWSMTKTITAGLIGTLVETGRMSLADNLVDSFPDWAEDSRRGITVADMLSMTGGLQWDEEYGDVSDVTRMLYLGNDMAAFAAERVPEAKPGTDFNYSSGTTTVLSRVWQDKLPDGGLTYPQTALFAPLGMASAILETDANDTFIGSSYMYATARDWARFGQLLLQKGVWDGARILPEGFVDWMVEPVDASDGRYAKGHLWLEAPGDFPPFEDAYWLQGHDGQFIGVFPSHDMVVLRMGLTPSRFGYSSLPLAQALTTAFGDDSS
ncbi:MULTISPECIES: serine hydrolase [unclassified Ruegeria]|uniref:serine hydrolase domain-containing protein n=1 Tax=unclassified Ruegeria TaxID=2625375 RepID=UPI001492ACC6|nr:MULTISPECIES: serine hydrolase [unclassified Ruegeria]NOD48097.1 serine hydrolase [Ruegeria sp. HKCCD5849]NOD53458.1 serine hydrolase [Ruegeria sp. HKCCD5851]NOD70064.1 serine hydrolase [Ruegeria sp. HKCCD7303]